MKRLGLRRCRAGAATGEDFRYRITEVVWKMSANTTEQKRNEEAIRRLYHLAEAASKDTTKFVSMFADGGYFYDVGAGKKYYGVDIGKTVDIYAAAFPDMHRELDNFYFQDDVVVVELSLNGTHKGGLALPAGTLPATGKEIHAPSLTHERERASLAIEQARSGRVVSLVSSGDIGVYGIDRKSVV